MEGLPGGCNPADVLFKLAHGRGIKPPIFDQVNRGTLAKICLMNNLLLRWQSKDLLMPKLSPGVVLSLR